MQTKREYGFSLIELMIVIAVVGILGAIAYPSYQDSLRKSRRADAKSALLQDSQFMERTYTTSNTYTPGGANPALPITQSPVDSATKYYDLAIFAADGNSFELRAVPIAGTSQENDACGTLSLSNTGQKNVVGATLSATECW